MPVSNVTTITYTADDCFKILEGILDELEELYANNPSCIEDNMLCILSRNDSVALDWYFATQERYRTVTGGVRNLTYLTSFCTLRFTIGNVGDPVISQMPREV